MAVVSILFKPSAISADWISMINKKYIIFTSIFLFYMVVYNYVIFSDVMYDDMLNYTAKGYAILHYDGSIWNMTVDIARNWIENGRAFIFAFYMYALFSVLDYYTYKVMIIIATFINAILIGIWIERKIKNDAMIYLLALLFPCVMHMSCEYFNPMFGFHFLLQWTVLLGMTSIVLFEKYLYTNNYWYSIVSCVALAISLFTYEIAYIIGLVFFIKLYFNQSKVYLLKLFPQYITYFVSMFIYFFVSITAKVHYPGVSVSINENTIDACIKQLSGSISVIVFGFNDIQYYLPVYNGERMDILFYAIISVILFYAFWKFIYKELYHINLANFEYKEIVASALLFIILPCILIGISARYQHEVGWGRAYLPTYLTAWGITIILAILIVKNKLCNICMLICGSMLFCNIVLSGISAANHRNLNLEGDELFRIAENTEMFKNWSEGDIIYDGSNILTGVDQHYCYLLKYKVQAYSDINELNKACYDIKTKNIKSVKYSVNYQNKLNGMVVGNCSSIEPQKYNDDIKFKIYSKDIDIFIPKEYNESDLKIQLSNGEYYEKRLNELQTVAVSEYGRKYNLKSEIGIDINSVNIVLHDNIK